MTPTRGPESTVRTYGELLRVPRFLLIFLGNALSTWGDYVARVTIAAIVFERTHSALATATALAVSFVPSFLGRSLLGPFVDRYRYKYVLVVAHSLRALCVLVLIALVIAEVPLVALLTVLAVLELVGGAATASGVIVMTDLFEQDKPLYGKAIALSAMAAQANQALGLAVGGSLVAWVGPRAGLIFDFITFVVSAVVVLLLVELRPVLGERGKGVRGFFRDLGEGVRDLAHHPVLARLVMLSVVSTVAIAAPEALAIPIAGGEATAGVLMASPVIGAFMGVLLIGRLDVHRQNSAILPLALTMPLPLIVIALEPPIGVVVGLFVVHGVLQAFMVPLQATFALTARPEMRGRIYSLAGAVSIGAAGISYLLAGWLGQHTSPHSGVAICAFASLVLIVGLALTWPHSHVSAAVESAYAPTSTSRAA